MAAQSLYEICLLRTVSLMKTGTWKTCSTNPFSNVPSGIIDDLMLCLTKRRVNLGEIYLRRVRLSDFSLLLTSGKLTHLRLNPFEFKKEYDLFLKIMRTNCCKEVRILTLYLPANVASNPLMETLISLCPKLEEFNSNIILPNFEVLKNCEGLRILRFRRSFDSHHSSADCSALALLGNLEFVSFVDMDSDIAFKVLQHCKKLISIGNNDSLNALKKIYDLKKYSSSTTDICDHFQLRKCVWVTNMASNSRESDKEISAFSEKVKIAVSLCPLVADLVICVYQGESVKELKKLKKLTILKIDFLYCVDDYLPNFFDLLHEIGPQLKFLFVLCAHTISVDIICEYCPNLLILDIHGDATVSNPVLTNHCLLLNKLRVTSADRESLLFLLSNCKRLEELIMQKVLCLDDCLLDLVLKVNPLAELTEISISQSSLSKEGFRALLQKAHSLQKVLTSSNSFGMVQSLIDELNLKTVWNGYFYDLPYHFRLQCGQIGLSPFNPR
ncbi:hypothetical protein AVEN_197597-1 [Araneus ventricosus]|uniref:F-box domain-containing protein n=1 Tax=Araneus ventricosus TaxID=182803 RepID=A0A4Y2NY96_ARAVE|nr:hypothetical protein AVEN_197597-1 [Araneus ventricosus]